MRDHLTLDVSPRTIRRIIQRTPHLEYVKRLHTPCLTSQHIKNRKDWARRVNALRVDWTTVIFTDEKKFNLDGPDGVQYYWHDLRNEKDPYFTRRFGGGGVMVWGGMSARGTTQLAILEGNQASSDYQSTLSNYLLHFCDSAHGGRYIFQQDNASIHDSFSTLLILAERRVCVLDWPSLSPDLNRIENVRGILAREAIRLDFRFENCHFGGVVTFGLGCPPRTGEIHVGQSY